MAKRPRAAGPAMALTQPPGAMATPGADLSTSGRRLVSQARAGPQTRNTWMTWGGEGEAGGRVLVGQQRTPTLSPQSALQAYFQQDRPEMIAAQQEQRAREEQGFDLTQAALTRGLGGMRQTAEEVPQRVGAAVERERAGRAGGQEEVRGEARAMGPRAEEAQQENVADVEQRTTEAMSSFADTTAAQIQNYRLAESRSLEQRIANIQAEASQRGVDPSDPGVAQQIQLETDRARDRLGQYVGRVSVETNAQRAQLQQNYNSLVANVRQVEAARTQQGYQAGMEGLISAQRMDDQFRSLALQETVVAEQTRAQLLTTADQMELAGNQWLAEWLRDESVYTNPIAPMIAWAFALQQAQSGGAAGDISTPNVQTQWTGGGERGAAFLPAGGGAGGQRAGAGQRVTAQPGPDEPNVYPGPPESPTNRYGGVPLPRMMLSRRR